VEFREYWTIAIKRGWIVILVAVVAAVAALGVSMLMPETYRATIQLSANPARADWGLNQATQDLLRNYVLNIKTHNMTQQAIDRAQLDMSTYDFLANLDVSADSSNMSITIQAESHDQDEAGLMAQTLADVFVEERRQWNSEQDKRDRIYVEKVDDIRDVPLASPKKRSIWLPARSLAPSWALSSCSCWNGSSRTSCAPSPTSKRRSRCPRWAPFQPGATREEQPAKSGGCHRGSSRASC